MHFNIGGEGEDTYLVRRGSCDWQGPLSLPPQENAPVVHTVCVHVCVHVWRLLSYKSAIHLSPAQRWKTKSSQSPLVQLTHKQPHTNRGQRQTGNNHNTTSNFYASTHQLYLQKVIYSYMRILCQEYSTMIRAHMVAFCMASSPWAVMVHPVQSDHSAITAAFCAAPKLATKVLMTPATDRLPW